jgi:transposase
MLAWEDECWFSRFAQPTMNAWTVDGKSVALLQQEKRKADPEPKAIACFGALDHESGKVYLRFSNGQPNSTYTLEFIEYLLSVAEQRNKWALVVIWDKASWHKSEQVRRWVGEHNRKVKKEGGVRLLTWLLPAKSPWLNPQEPHWMHCKRHVVEPDGTLTQRQLKERVRDYFGSDAPIN